MHLIDPTGDCYGQNWQVDHIAIIIAQLSAFEKQVPNASWPIPRSSDDCLQTY
jgi:hypothetical protein